jgi:hypothetical protein
MRIYPFNAWVCCDISAKSITWKLQVNRSQPDVFDYLRGRISRLALVLVAFLFRDMPGVRGRKDTLGRMIAVLAPVFDGGGVTK